MVDTEYTAREIVTRRGRAQVEYKARPIFLPVLQAIGGGCIALTATRLSSTRVRVDFSQPTDTFPGLSHPVNWRVEDVNGLRPNLTVLSVTLEPAPSPTWAILDTTEQHSGTTYRAVYETPCSGTASQGGGGGGGGGSGPIDTSRASIHCPRINSSQDTDGGFDAGPAPELGGLTSLVVAGWFWIPSLASAVARLLHTGNGRYSIRAPITVSLNLHFEMGSNSTHTVPGPGLSHGVMYHFVHIYDGAGAGNEERSRAWVNSVRSEGTFVNTVPASLPAPTQNLFLGASGIGGLGLNQTSNAYLDDFAIWRGLPDPHLLGDDLALELYNRSLRLDLSTCSIGLPDRWYRGDGIVGGTVPDLGSDGIDGTISGAVARDPFIYRRAA